MKEKIEEKKKELAQIINTIQEYQKAVQELNTKGIELQGQLKLLEEMEVEKSGTGHTNTKPSGNTNNTTSKHK